MECTQHSCVKRPSGHAARAENQPDTRRPFRHTSQSLTRPTLAPLAPCATEYKTVMLVEMYERWLFEVWGNGNETVAAELLHADLLDHNALPGQPKGREGDLWAARSVRTAFPDLQFTLDQFRRGR